jgi:hypothetical protein
MGVGQIFGLRGRQPTLLQETNNTVVWLKPDPVIAKVASRPNAEPGLLLEHAIAAQLAERQAETARPMSGTGPTRHGETGYLVTLWERLEDTGDHDPAPSLVEVSIRRLHAALAQTTVQVPSFRVSITDAQAALENDTLMAALSPNDRDFLRGVFRDGLAALDELKFEERRLHGEPHEGNRVVTQAGLRWLDFESSCVGPLEWDISSLPTTVGQRFPEVNPVLLHILGRLNSARVATWCWGGARFPEMRRHGDIHLSILRGQSNRY